MLSIKNFKQAIRLFWESNFFLLVKPHEFKKVDSVFKGIISVREFNEKEMFLLLDLIPKNSVVLDVGANMGVYTYCFQEYGNNLNIIAFEPIPRLYKRLKKLFPNVKVYSYALSSQSQMALFKIPIIRDISFLSRGTLNIDFLESNENKSAKIIVKTIALDELILKGKIKKIDFIKIDVEGHELDMLKGSAIALKRFKPTLLIEIEERHHSDISIETIFNYLVDIGYLGFFLDINSKTLRGIAELNIERNQNLYNFNSNSYINNFIFFQSDSSLLFNLKQKLLQY